MKLFVARDEVPQHVLAMGSVDEELVLIRGTRLAAQKCDEAERAKDKSHGCRH